MGSGVKIELCMQAKVYIYTALNRSPIVSVCRVQRTHHLSNDVAFSCSCVGGDMCACSGGEKIILTSMCIHCRLELPTLTHLIW